MTSRILSFMVLMVVIAPFAGGADRRIAPRAEAPSDSQAESNDDTTSDSTPADETPDSREKENAPTGGNVPCEMGLRPNMVDSAERVVRSSGSSRHLLAAFRPITRVGLLPREMNLRLERVLAQVRSVAPTIEVEAPASRPHAPPTCA